MDITSDRILIWNQQNTYRYIPNLEIEDKGLLGHLCGPPDAQLILQFKHLVCELRIPLKTSFILFQPFKIYTFDKLFSE